jgi:hypothetical protein
MLQPKLGFPDLLGLTPKIPSVFLPIFAISEWNLEEVTIGSWSYLVEHQSPKITAPHSMGSKRL